MEHNAAHCVPPAFDGNAKYEFRAKKMYIDVVSDVFVLFHWALIVRGRCTLFGMYLLAGAGMKFGLLSVMEKRTPCSGGVIGHKIAERRILMLNLVGEKKMRYN